MKNKTKKTQIKKRNYLKNSKKLKVNDKSKKEYKL